MVHLGSRGFTRLRLRVTGVFRVRVGSLERAKGSTDTFCFAWDHLGSPIGRWVHLSSLRFIRARLWFVGIIPVRVGSFRRI